MKSKKKLNLTKWVIFFIFIFLWNTFFCFCQNINKLKVNGNINIHQNQALRFKPVSQSTTPPSNPSQGDLYFDGSSLLYYDGSEWQTIAQEGDIFFNRRDNTLYYYDGEKWRAVKGGGQKTVATRIVAAYDSLDTTCNGGICSNPRADYTCDGTDDQEEIQKAIDDLGSNGGVVYLLEGTYNLSSPIVFDDGSSDGIDDSNKSLIGTGAGTLLKTSGDAIKLDSVSRVLISKLRISGGHCIRLYNTHYSTITSIWSDGYIMLYNNSSYNIFSHNFFAGEAHIGDFSLNAASYNNIICGNHFYYTRSSNNAFGAIFLYDWENTLIIGNISIDGGIWLFESSHNLILANQISTKYRCGPGGVRGIILLNGGSAYNIISSNLISNCTADGPGVSLYDSSFNLITSNLITEVADHGISIETLGWDNSNNNSIVGNLIHNVGAGYDGIVVSSEQNLISSNRINSTNSSRYGIYITSSDNYLVGNFVDGNFQKKIKDSGNNTKYTQKEKITIERKEVNLNNGDTLEVATSPRGYVALKATTAITLDATKAISDGKAQGDLLILEGTSDTNTITILNGANVKLGSIKRVLGKEDTLTLIWNGNDWVEMDYANN